MEQEKRDILLDLQRRGGGGLKHILETISDFIVVLDREARMLYVNHVRHDTDWHDNLQGASIFRDEWLTPESQALIRRALDEAFENQTSSSFEIRGVAVGDQSLSHWYWSRLHPFVRNGEVIAAIYVSSEITGQKRTQRLLAEKEELQRGILDAMSDGVFAFDPDGRVTLWNHAMANFSGIPDGTLVGASEPIWALLEDFPESEVRDIQARTAAGERVRRERVVQDASGAGPREYVGLYHGLGAGEAAGGVVGVVRDVTDLRRAQEERERMNERMQQAQKLESLGVLAGGIAHDFNNLLVSILGYADLAQLDLPASSRAHGMIGHISGAAQKAAELCRQMLAYSGKGKFIVRAVDLNEIVREMGSLMEVSISKKAALRLGLCGEPLVIEADGSQLNQVILNLIVNASDALGDASGIISIRTERRDCDAAWLRTLWSHDELPGGAYAEIEVSDTGCGMDAETQKRIFEPFFTTKFTGRGLGMAAVLGIIRGHRGAIKIYSEKGKGTTFKILLPALDRKSASPASPDARIDWPRGARVLVVDDEPGVLEFLATALELHGCEVLTARDGRQCLDIFREGAPGIALVILDMTMPTLDGVETFRELRRIRPDARVILSSGYNEQEAVNRFAGKGLAGFLQKPYSLDALKRALADALREDTPPREG